MSDNNIWKLSAVETSNAVKNKKISATDSIKARQYRHSYDGLAWWATNAKDLGNGHQ